MIRKANNRMIRSTALVDQATRPIGAWGLGSDENELVYDFVGLGATARVRGVRHLTAQQLISIPAELLRERPVVLSEPGVVVLLLKLGCTLDRDIILEAVAALESELRLDTSSLWSDVVGRKSVVRYECMLLKAALRNENMLPGDPIGSLGSWSGGSPPRIQTEEDDYDSDPDDGPESSTIGMRGTQRTKSSPHLRFGVGDRVEANISTALGRTYFSPGHVVECFKLVEPDDPMPDAMIGKFSAYTIDLYIGMQYSHPETMIDSFVSVNSHRRQ